MKINKPIYKTIMWIIKSIVIWLLIALGLIAGIFILSFILYYIIPIAFIMTVGVYVIGIILYIKDKIRYKYEFYKDVYEEYESEENVNE